ncbi:MAG: mismatch repair protein MutS [Betaproteobacteria bacterium]|nr:mismatch repair protein MutS [Betaproteobacteria bacterium]
MPSSFEHLAVLRKELEQRRRAEEERVRRARAEEEKSRREAALFRDATRDVLPLAAPPRAAAPAQPVPPIPHMHRRDEADALASSLSDGISAETLIDTDEALSYAREGIGPDVLRKLRRGQWVIQGEIDLHGMTRDQAREEVARFLQSATKEGKRCVRIVHGKGLGSKNRTSVLKAKVRHWLMQTEAVLAFTQARGADGGAGAVIVLLRPTPP